MNRRLVIAVNVMLFHLAALWALQSGLLRRAVEIVVPAAILSEFVAPPAPRHEVVKAPAPAIKPQPRPVQKSVEPAPQPLAMPSPTPAPAAPVGVTTPAPALPALTAPVAPAAAPAPPAPPRLDLPSSDAAYLNNPKPPYPALSKRLGEQGKVVVRVLIGIDGTAQQAEIRSSSSYERLDQAALATALKWRYVPGKRGGVPEAMWFNVPISFVLE
jgi:protein TonB